MRAHTADDAERADLAEAVAANPDYGDYRRGRVPVAS
jgi:hypothetical protein